MISFNNHIRKNLPAIFLLVFLLFLPSCRYLKQKLKLGEYSLNSAIEWARKDSTRVADSLKGVSLEKSVPDKKLNDSMKQVMADKKEFERALTDSLMSLDDQGPLYYVITGSFSNHDNALKAAKKYSDEGFNTGLIRVSGNNGSFLELVSVKSFSDYSEARAFLKGFKGIYDPGAWMYKKK